MGTVEEISDPLNTLGYDAAWLDYGFLDAATLSAQFAAFQSGDDPFPEHYRYATFRQILAARSVMDEETIAHYLHLAAIDANPGMAHAALGDLLQWEGLTESQLATLREHSQCAAPVLQKLISRRHSFWLLEDDLVSEEIFEACLASGDAHVQRSLVVHKAIAPAQLEILAERGTTRAVRNMAQARRTRKKEKA